MGYGDEVLNEFTPIAPTESEQIHAQAVEWLMEQREVESWTPQDQVALDAWLDISPAHMIAYWRAESGWKRTEVLAAMQSFRPLQREAPRSRRPFAKIAASALILVGVSFMAFYSASPRYTTYVTPVGMRKTLTLADGSSIELNTDTVVRVASSDNQRRVILDKGEAFFQVKHNAERPFVVTVGNRQITDLGTKFFVRQHFDDVEVGLVEGSARFDATIADGGNRSVTLTPGDRVFATATSFTVTRNEIPVLENDLGWRRGILIFRHTTLAEAVSEFNRYNTRKIVIDDPGVAKLEILGTFRTGDIARFARVAGTALSLKIIKRDNDIVLSKQP